MRETVLLTGASGMLGRNILEHSRADEFIWLCPSHQELNLLNQADVHEYINRYKPDIVIHAAAKVGGIQANIREPTSFLIENFEIGKNVLSAAHKSGTKRVLNIGSTCMYPANRSNPLAEKDVLTGALEPTNEGYALAKLAIARLAAYYNREHSSCRYKTLIFCNLYGRHDSFDPVRSHLIPAVIKKLVDAKYNGMASVEIWGDGSARREFMYSADAADGVFFCIDKIDSLPEMLNVGLGYDLTVKDYYEIAAKVVGYTGSFHFDLAKPVGMSRKLSDTTLINSLGWSPSYSIEDGLSRTYAYYSEFIGVVK